MIFVHNRQLLCSRSVANHSLKIQLYKHLKGELNLKIGYVMNIYE
jgi:hypothetical protein